MSQQEQSTPSSNPSDEETPDAAASQRRVITNKPMSIIHRESSSSMTSGRPSLLAGLTLPAEGSWEDDDGQLAPPRPRRLWRVNDTSLKPVPYFYPPLDPRCSVFVSDAPPSVVAVRIGECLRKRSISVEYDEEAVRDTIVWWSFLSATSRLRKMWIGNHIPSLLSLYITGDSDLHDCRPMSFRHSIVSRIIQTSSSSWNGYGLKT